MVKLATITKDENDSGDILNDNNIFLFFDEFDDQTVKPATQFILEKNLSKNGRPSHLTLIINSPGGELTSAFALIDIMNGSDIPIHTVGVGQIASCGLLVFMSGAKGHRLLTPNTSILSHQWSGDLSGKEHELVAQQKENELTNARVLHHYKKITKLKEKIIKKVLLPANDVFLSAEEAIEYGLADAIKLPKNFD